MDYRKTAKQILDGIGGKENLVSSAHCATRLRLVIADNNKAKKEILENIDGVKGVFEASGQLQIIIGTGTVNKVFDEFIDLAGVVASTKDEVKAKATAKSPFYKRAIKALGDIFVPIIPAIVATGLLNGLLGGLVQVFPNISSSNIYTLLNMFSNTALTFLPILIAISAAKIFGGNQFLGAVIGMLMIHPDLVNAWTVSTGAETSTLWSWFGLWNIQNVGYQGHVIPVILSVWLMSAIEKRLHKKVPEMLDLFVTPLVSVLVSGFFSLTLIGPAFAQLETWVLQSAQFLISVPLGIGAFIMGGVYAPSVVAGVHHMYNAIEMMMLADNGMNTWMPIATAANVAQGAAALAVAFKCRNKKTKALALPASLSAFMGITEPAIFGVNVRFMRPFIAGMIGGAFGGAIASIFNVYATANGVTGLFGLLITTDSILGYILTMAVSFGIAFALSWIFGIKEPEISEMVSYNNTEIVSHDNEITSPIIGEVIKLEDVPDETFATGVLGNGVGIIPSEGKIVAPSDCKISTVFDTKHAIGLELENGVEMLIHVGINTVELNGEGFETHVTEGETVKKGQTLVTFNMKIIKEKGYNLTTPVLISNSDEFAEILPISNNKVNFNDVILTVKKEK